MMPGQRATAPTSASKLEQPGLTRDQRGASDPRRAACTGAGVGKRLRERVGSQVGGRGDLGRAGGKVLGAQLGIRLALPGTCQ